MGKFETKNIEGIKSYDVINKGTFAKVYALDRLLSLYSFEAEGAKKIVTVYYDTPAGLLERAGLTLCKVVTRERSYFMVEKQLYLPKASLVKIREDKYFVHDISPNDTIKQHMFFLADGITQLFTTTFNIDLENVLKTCVPKIDIITNTSVVKVFSGNGFKAKINFDTVLFKNHITKKNVPGLGMTVELASPKTFMPSYEDFTSKLEKYCKEIIPINESRYQQAVKYTQK